MTISKTPISNFRSTPTMVVCAHTRRPRGPPTPTPSPTPCTRPPRAQTCALIARAPVRQRARTRRHAHHASTRSSDRHRSGLQARGRPVDVRHAGVPPAARGGRSACGCAAAPALRRAVALGVFAVCVLASSSTATDASSASTSAEAGVQEGFV